MGQAAFLHNIFFFNNDHNIYLNEYTLIIYLAALAGTDLDILFREVDLLTNNHTYTPEEVGHENRARNTSKKTTLLCVAEEIVSPGYSI